MVNAGETAQAGRVPGERINTTIRTVNSPNITTTETVIDTVVASVVLGRIYRVTWTGELDSSVAADDITQRLKPDTIGSTLIAGQIVDIPVSFRHPRTFLDVEYTADATEDKTFLVTLERTAGTGNVSSPAAATQPNYFYVDYIRG